MKTALKLLGSWTVLTLPNPLMTAEIRRFHFIESASSNFVFGMCLGWLLSHSHAPKLAVQSYSAR